MPVVSPLWVEQCAAQQAKVLVSKVSSLAVERYQSIQVASRLAAGVQL